MQKDLLIAAADTLSQINDAIARFYCGESKTLVPDGPNRWRVTWAHDGEMLQGVEVRLNGGRYRFIAPAKPTPYREELTPAGPQLVIPGCDRVPVPGKPATAQLSLFG